MDISIIGTGYIGSVTGACFAEMGHHVIFVGRDTQKLDAIKSGKSPIFEPGLDQLLLKNNEKIETTTDIAVAVKKSELTFICVGTPPRKDGASDLSQVETVSHSIGKALRSDAKYHTIRIIVDHLESLPDVAQLEVLDFVEFLQTRKMYYEERRADDKSWCNFSLASAMRGMEDEDTSYTSADIIEPRT